MTKTVSTRPLVRADDRPEEAAVSHPLNPKSEMHHVSLGDAAGLERMGVHLIRLAAGKESCVYHTHTNEEEWLFILAGRGVAEIDGQEYAVGPGDFMGFSTPSVGHHLRNDGDDDLMYLVGGERKDVEIAEFPNLGKIVIRSGGVVDIVDREDVQRIWPPKDPPGEEV